MLHSNIQVHDVTTYQVSTLSSTQAVDVFGTPSRPCPLELAWEPCWEPHRTPCQGEGRMGRSLPFGRSETRGLRVHSGRSFRVLAFTHACCSRGQDRRRNTAVLNRWWVGDACSAAVMLSKVDVAGVSQKPSHPDRVVRLCQANLVRAEMTWSQRRIKFGTCSGFCLAQNGPTPLLRSELARFSDPGTNAEESLRVPSTYK